MSDVWEQSVLSAFEEWWNAKGHATHTSDPDAFLAGAEWQRERDARVAERIGAAPKVRDGRPDEATQIACEIRKGDA